MFKLLYELFFILTDVEIGKIWSIPKKSLLEKMEFPLTTFLADLHEIDPVIEQLNRTMEKIDSKVHVNFEKREKVPELREVLERGLGKFVMNFKELLMKNCEYYADARWVRACWLCLLT